MAKKATKAATKEHEGYQGWKNYETWAVALWIDNDQGTQEYWQDRVAEIEEEFSGRENNDRRDVVWAVADALKDWHEEMAFESPNNGGLGFDDKGVFTDLLRAAMGEVDWKEVAESLIQTASENAKYKKSRR